MKIVLIPKGFNDKRSEQNFKSAENKSEKRWANATSISIKKKKKEANQAEQSELYWDA